MPDKASVKLKILDILQAHLDAGNKTTVENAIRDRVHPNTFKNWMKDKQRAVRGYKSDVLLEIGRHLPSVDHVRTAAVYDFALDELEIDRASQAGLSQYDGTYFFRHNFHFDHTANLRWIRIIAQNAPRFSIFLTKFTHMGNRFLCDGLVLIRPRRMYLLGISPSAILFAHLEPVRDPASALIKGTALFESINEEQMCLSNIVLHQRPPDLLNSQEKESIKNHIGLS